MSRLRCPEARKVVAWAETQGWAARLTNGHHIRLERAGMAVVIPREMGERRCAKNSLALLKRKMREQEQQKIEKP